MKSSLFARVVGPVSMAASLAACGGGTNSGMDAGRDAGRDVVTAVDHPSVVDAPTSCSSDSQCDDGTYCNGPEHCAPGGVGADVRGCVRTGDPCSSTETCTESTRSCVPMSCTHPSTPDADGDGHRDVACGGDDCDDHDANRFPGNTEVCAVESVATDGGMVLTRTDTATGLDPTHDEDCDPTSFANGATHDGDHDHDNTVDRACANTDRNGVTYGGTDCADLDPVAAMPLTLHASVPATDIHPSQPELCNGVDDNCDGTIDELNPGGGGTCTAGSGQCSMGVLNCAQGALRCSATGMPSAETCNGQDDDCDGMTDENPTTLCPGTPSGTATCISGQCGISCAGGFVNCSNTCQNLTDACDDGEPGFCRIPGTYVCAGAGRRCAIGGHPRLATQTWAGDSPALGHTIGRTAPGYSYFTSGVDPVPGYLQFGPYVDLPPGSYSVAIHFQWWSDPPTLLPGGGSITFDVVENHGGRQLATTSRSYFNQSTVDVATMNFTVTEACAADLEFRVYIATVNSPGPTSHARVDSTVLTQL